MTGSECGEERLMDFKFIVITSSTILGFVALGIVLLWGLHQMNFDNYFIAKYVIPISFILLGLVVARSIDKKREKQKVKNA